MRRTASAVALALSLLATAHTTAGASTHQPDEGNTNTVAYPELLPLERLGIAPWQLASIICDRPGAWVELGR